MRFMRPKFLRGFMPATKTEPLSNARSVKRSAALRSLAILTVIAVGAPSLMGEAKSSPLRSAPVEALADSGPVTLVAGHSSRAAEQLKKAFRPHFPPIRITREMKALLGDPNITVRDYRGGSNRTTYVCSFINTSGKRAIVCD